MKILVLPHDPMTGMKTRSRELAQALCELGHEVEIYRVRRQSAKHWWGKLWWHLRQIFCRPQVEQEASGLGNLYLPNIVLRRPRWLVENFGLVGTFLLNRRHYDLVLNASYWGPSRRRQANSVLLYDLVDDHKQEAVIKRDEQLFQLIERRIRREMDEADQVITCSMVMQELIQNDYAKASALVPNGARTRWLREQASDCQQGAKSVGYFGGLDGWVKIPMVVEALKLLREQGENFEFMIYGRGESLNPDELPDFCHYQGFIAPEKIPETFAHFQIGLVPFEVMKFTDPVLPLKLMEYGAARRIAVASSLKELQLQQLPWVVLAEPNPESFAAAILKAAQMQWDPGWDEVVDRFSWEAGARKILALASQLRSASSSA